MGTEFRSCVSTFGIILKHNSDAIIYLFRMIVKGLPLNGLYGEIAGVNAKFVHLLTREVHEAARVYVNIDATGGSQGHQALWQLPLTNNSALK